MMVRVYKYPVFCNLLEKGSLYQFWKNSLIYWKKRSNFHQDFVFIFLLKFELSGQYFSRGQVKWFGLANVRVIGVRVIKWFLWESISEGSTGIKKQFEFEFELLEVRVIGGSSYRECTIVFAGRESVSSFQPYSGEGGIAKRQHFPHVPTTLSDF